MIRRFYGREMKHTPGKWGRIWVDGKWVIDANGGKTDIATVVHRSDADETESNARLIESSPELLDALCGLLATAKVIQSANDSLRQNGIHAAGFAASLLTDAEAAIAKALGE